MRLIITFFLAVATGLSAQAQFVAKLQLKERIPGTCSKKDVYALLQMFDGQVPAKCASTTEQINDKLNADVQFLKDKPDYNDKGMVNFIINCKGEMVQCAIDNKTQSPELDTQIENVFKTFTSWTAGTLNKKEVDCSVLISFKIEKGRITLNR